MVGEGDMMNKKDWRPCDRHRSRHAGFKQGWPAARRDRPNVRVGQPNRFFRNDFTALSRCPRGVGLKPPGQQREAKPLTTDRARAGMTCGPGGPDRALNHILGLGQKPTDFAAESHPKARDRGCSPGPLLGYRCRAAARGLGLTGRVDIPMFRPDKAGRFRPDGAGFGL